MQTTMATMSKTLECQEGAIKVYATL